MAAVVVAAVALAGCGDDLEEFRDDLRPLEQRAAAERSRISSQLRAVRLGSDQDARALRAATGKLKGVYDEIAELEPPDGYERPFVTYVRSNGRAVRNLDRFAVELAAGHARPLRRMSRRIVQDLARSQRARLRWIE